MNNKSIEDALSNPCQLIVKDKEMPKMDKNKTTHCLKSWFEAFVKDVTREQKHESCLVDINVTEKVKDFVNKTLLEWTKVNKVFKRFSICSVTKMNDGKLGISIKIDNEPFATPIFDNRKNALNYG